MSTRFPPLPKARKSSGRASRPTAAVVRPPPAPKQEATDTHHHTCACGGHCPRCQAKAAARASGFIPAETHAH